MDTDKGEPIYKAESQQIVRCAMDVLNELGHGFNEKPYENSLVVELRLRGIPYEQQRQFDILYKQEKVGDYIPDLLAFGKIVVDTKVIEKNNGQGSGPDDELSENHGLPAWIYLEFQKAETRMETRGEMNISVHQCPSVVEKTANVINVDSSQFAGRGGRQIAFMLNIICQGL